MFAYPNTYEDIEELVDRANALAEDHERLQKLLNLDEPGTSAPAGPVRRNQATEVDGVKLKFGTKPIEWTNRKTGKPTTNVTNVRWYRDLKKWRVERIDHTGKKVHVGYCATLVDAVEARRGIKDGVKGPGELVVHADGTVHVTKCSHCCHSFPLGHFAPVPCLNNLQKLPRFEAATAAFASTDALERKVAWAALSVMPEKKKRCTALRTGRCFTCRESMHKSVTQGNSDKAACYRMAQEIRADMAKRGCSHPDCTECRPECFEGDHKDRVGKRCAQYTCTSYMWFVEKYGANGPAEMWKCYKGTRPLCKNHHIMEDSHTGSRGADSTTLVDKKQKRWRKNREECGAYNDARKIGKNCKYCKMRFTKANVRMGAWTHPADGTGKTTGVSELVKTGTSLKTMKPRIDRVIDVECNGAIACHNCHHAEETFPMFKRQEERFKVLVSTMHKWGGGDERTRGVKRPREDECPEPE